MSRVAQKEGERMKKSKLYLSTRENGTLYVHQAWTVQCLDCGVERRFDANGDTKKYLKASIVNAALVRVCQCS